MLNLTTKRVVAISSRYQKDINDLVSSQGPALNPMLELLALTKIQTDLPLLLSALNNHKNSKMYNDAQTKLLDLSNQVDELLYSAVKRSNEFSDRYVSKETHQPEVIEDSPLPATNEEDLASLRKRLLQDGTSTSLDNASTDQMNDYHETFQEDLLSDLGELASALKTSASTLSSKILDDSKLVSTTGENMERNLTLMLAVGTNLNGYLNEKTGGKISLFFLIKTMVFIFILTFFMIVLIKILPRM